jgi:hypothetical protein
VSEPILPPSDRRVHRFATPPEDAVAAGVVGDGAVARAPRRRVCPARIASQARQVPYADQDDVVTMETVGLAQVGRPTVARAPDRIDHGVGLFSAAIGGLRR